MADPDWSKPCEVLAWLRPQYYQAAAGTAVVRVQYDNNLVEYSARNNNLPQLDALIRRLERECALASGTSRRRAFIAG